MSNNSNSLVVCDILISQDAEGRFCLNDLHKAAGNESRHQPAKWLITQQAIELVELLKSEESITGIPVIFLKQGLGTFVIKELVYAYAMWISPKFHLQVIRAYDALVVQKTLDFEFLKPITEPIDIRDFEWRYQVIMQMLKNLKKAQVNFTITLTGEELLASKCFEK